MIAILFRNVRVRQVRPASYGILRSLEFIRCVRDRQKCQASLDFFGIGFTIFTQPVNQSCHGCKDLPNLFAEKWQKDADFKIASICFEHLPTLCSIHNKSPTSNDSASNGKRDQKTAKQRFITCSATSILRRSSRHSFLLTSICEREIGIQAFPNLEAIVEL